MNQTAAPWVCAECGLPFRAEMDLDVHRFIRHGVYPSWSPDAGKPPRTAVCPTCHERYGVGLGLAVHQGLDHPAPAPAPVELFPGYTPLAPPTLRFGGHRSRHDAAPPPPPGDPDD
ncbi:hypothetical protein ABT255_42365 [Streptomyces mirabilis]|uniref:hypothetical protein n=1 Tax=Streptomyces mirabilis TaxID=68239 RepID=UPI00331F742F